MNLLRSAAAAALVSAAAAGVAQPLDAPARQPMNPETIREVQQVLKDQGYDIGPVDGRWGRLTRIGVKNFQLTSHILRPTGELDAQTLSALGVQPQSVAGTPGSSSTGASRPPSPGASFP